MNELPTPASFEIAQNDLLYEAEQTAGGESLPPATQVPVVLPPQLHESDGAGVFYSSPLFTSFTDSGISADRLSSAHSWIETLVSSDIGNPEATHGYEIRSYLDSFGEADQPILTSFLNHAASAGWTQEEINQSIEWYQGWTAESAQGELEDAHLAADDARSIEQLDSQDRDQARGKMRERWGSEYDSNISLINKHLDGMTNTHREWFESADETGRLRLNRPDILERLARDARASVPPVLVHAAKEHGSERAAIEAMMGDRNSPYWRGPDAAQIQARFRDLISSGDTGTAKPLPQGSGISAEIASIEHVMRTDRQRYNKDTEMQQRLLELYELRG